MAKFIVNGMDTLEHSFQDLATLTDEQRGRILQAGAEAIKAGQVDYLTQHHKRTGDLAASIQIKNDNSTAEVKPKGKKHKRSGGVRRSKHHGAAKSSTNAEIAYYLAFGTPRMAATHWDEYANEASAEKTTQAMAAAWDEILTEKGL